MTLHASDLLRAAFPGGSITGAPKVRAMEIIDELEPQRRNAWCGSIGYLSYCGNMDTSITIAGVQRHWQAGGDGADQMMDRRERLHHEQLGDPDAARDGDAADVVAHQVDNH